MNQQILRLAASHFPRDGEGNIQATPETISEFAELIVRECCDIFVELRTRPADLAVKDVKKHFGVEQ